MEIFRLQNLKQDSKPFLKIERKHVLWVINHEVDVYVMNILKWSLERKKKLYICVIDLVQKWDENAIWFESHAKSMSLVKRENDLNLDLAIKKNCSQDSNQAFYDSSHGFEPTKLLI